MGATHDGGIKSRDKILKDNPNFYRELGRAGGKAGRGSMYNGGFAQVDQYGNAIGKERAREAGRKGGLKSRRNKTAHVEVQTAPEIKVKRFRWKR